ncbi:MAG: response regulator [Desulfobulbaceae bacterium]|nr:response regulator [Desulfobulbaceae bacterium]
MILSKSSYKKGNKHLIESIKRILVVDNEPEFARTIQRHLRREGFLSNVTYDKEDAVNKIEDSFGKGNPFDLIITDVIMPNRDGVKLLQWIQKTHPEISVLIISAYNDNGSVSKNIRPGMDLSAQKSLTPKEMMALICHIGHKRNRCRTTDNH